MGIATQRCSPSELRIPEDTAGFAPATFRVPSDNPISIDPLIDSRLFFLARIRRVVGTTSAPFALPPCCEK